MACEATFLDAKRPFDAMQVMRTLERHCQTSRREPP